MTTTIKLNDWITHGDVGTLNGYLNALDQHPQSADVQIMQQQAQQYQANSLAQYQNCDFSGLANICTGLSNTNPVTPERIAYLNSETRSSLADEGNKIIEKMAFWNEIPVVGAVVSEHLADRLEAISNRIEELAEPCSS